MSVLRHFKFVKPRWNSSIDPQRGFCCIYVAVCMLLALLICDERIDLKTRNRCQTLMDFVTPTIIVTAGVSADWSSEMDLILRAFDVIRHDPALSLDQIEECIRRLKRLFQGGYAAISLPNNADDENQEAKTCLQIAVEQVVS